jgi:hypothetical protein
MRPELKQLDYYTYGLTEYDFDYIVRLVQRVREAHIERTQRAIAPYRDDPELAEAVDDDAYYTYVDTLYLWEYAIWRLQGIFEGLITTVFLAGRTGPRRAGMRAKLEAMEAAGYSLEPELRQQLLDWVTLRNALSHAPPEQFRPIWIEESDVVEFKNLLANICFAWRTQLSIISGPAGEDEK